MSVIIGGSYFFCEKITAENISDIRNEKSPIKLTLWERVKDYFFSTGKEKAYSCISNLINIGYELNFEEAKSNFFTLKSLAAEGCKNQFLEYSHHDSTGSLINVLELKSYSWDTLIKIKYFGNKEQFLLEVLDKKMTSL